MKLKLPLIHKLIIRQIILVLGEAAQFHKYSLLIITMEEKTAKIRKEVTKTIAIVIILWLQLRILMGNKYR